MGNTGSLEEVKDKAVLDEGIVTVNTVTVISSSAEGALLQRLKDLPQVRQESHGKSSDDQVWRDLACYSQEQLELDPRLTLSLLKTYKTWCESQATTVAQQQDFVNDRIGDIDKLVAKVFEKCLRRQQALENTTKLFRSLTSTQQQMEDLSRRLTACTTVLQAAHQQQEHAG